MAAISRRGRHTRRFAELWISAIKNDLAEVGIPGPAILFTRFPQLGTLLLKGTGVTAMPKDIATIRRRTKE
jgi:hypothetical protein